MSEVNLDHTHACLMAALHGLIAGKRLSDAVTVPTSFGTQAVVANALVAAQNYLHEDFTEEQLDTVDAAFAALDGKRPSKRKDECAAAIMALAVKPRK